jgi:hypothetical protein
MFAVDPELKPVQIHFTTVMALKPTARTIRYESGRPKRKPIA